MNQEEFLCLTDIAIASQEIELLDILTSHANFEHADNDKNIVDMISREYTGIDSETDMVISCILHDIQHWYSSRLNLSRTTKQKKIHSGIGAKGPSDGKVVVDLSHTVFILTNKLDYSYKKLVYLVLENIIQLIKP